MRERLARTMRTGAVAAVAGFALVLAACSGGGSGTTGGDGTGGDEPRHLGVITPAPFVSWDPIAAFTPYGGGLYYQAVYDTLIREDASGELQPNLATGWEYDDSLTTLTMDLRSDVTFTDGAAFDADAAVANLERTRVTPGPRIADLANVTSVTAVDADTIELVLSAPDPGLVEQLARAAGQMASPASLDAGTFEAPVGSGPYVLDAANTVDGESYAFVRNEDYWNAEAWGFDSVTVQWVPDPSARLNALKAGQVNATAVEFTQLEEAASAGLTAMEFGGGLVGIQFLDLAGDSPISDVRVRQAINYALDADALSEAFSAGTGRVSDQPFGPHNAGFVDSLEDHYTHDVAKAKQLLAEAGYPDGVTITLPDSSGAFPGLPIMDAIVQQLGEAGITVEVVDSALDFPEIVNQMFTAAYPAWVTQWALASDWNVVSQWLLPSSTFNPFHVENPEVQALIDDVRGSTGEDQVKAYQALNTFLVDQAWGAWLYATPYGYAHDDTVVAQEHLGEQSAWLGDLSPAE